MKRRDFLCCAAAGVPVGGALGITGKVAFDRITYRSSPYARLSYAEDGEDLVLYDLLHYHLKLDHPTYLDLGAADPIRGNDTYLLYINGSRGVLVEPNPTYVAKLMRVRPHDIVLPFGVGVTNEEAADYYVIKDSPPLNTFSRKQVEMHQRGSAEDIVEKVLKMRLVKIDQIISEHLGRAPDLLSIDVEGLDLDILRTLDFKKFRPGVICAETIRQGTHDVNTDIVDLLKDHGYTIRGGSFINSIFVDPGRLA
jgi:FkbM family methyltransferase